MRIVMGEPRDRILTRIILDPQRGCWIWEGALTRNGYTSLRFKRDGKVRAFYAHRVSYEAFIGPIPDGLDLDHLCRNRACCNPAHLEPVTRSVNLKRGLSGRVFAEKQKAKTHCPSGHPYSGYNLYMYGRGEGPKIYRGCRECKKLKARLIRSRKREKAAMDATAISSKLN